MPPISQGGGQKSYILELRQKYDYTTHCNIGIDDVAEEAVGDVPEHIGSQTGADDNSTKAETIICQDSCSQEAIIGPNDGHHHIAYQEIGLRHRHVMFLRRLTLDEIKHGRRALHTKEAPHQSAQCSCPHLYSFSCRQFYLLTEQREIDTDKNECHTKDSPQYIVFDTRQGEDSNG